MSEALFGPSIKEVLRQVKIGFDSHFGTINVVYCDEHGTPLDSSSDKTAEFLHSLDCWFRFYSSRNKSSTIKIEKTDGNGFVIAIIPISQHKVEKGWFVLYMEKDGWRNPHGQYWKDGKCFDVIDNKVVITTNVGKTDESSITLNIPKDELQVKIMLELIK